LGYEWKLNSKSKRLSFLKLIEYLDLTFEFHIVPKSILEYKLDCKCLRYAQLDWKLQLIDIKFLAAIPFRQFTDIFWK